MSMKSNPLIAFQYYIPVLRHNNFGLIYEISKDIAKWQFSTSRISFDIYNSWPRPPPAALLVEPAIMFCCCRLDFISFFNFSPPDVRVRSVDCHQTSPHVRRQLTSLRTLEPCASTHFRPFPSFPSPFPSPSLRWRTP